MKQSAAAWAEIGKFMDKSFEGLIHTEVQTQQNQGKVALYPRAPGWRTSRRVRPQTPSSTP